jgi:hypothetical protein
MVGPPFCFACLGNSASHGLKWQAPSSLVPGSGHDALGSVAAAPAGRCRATCCLLSCQARPWGLHGHLLGAAWSAPLTAGMRSVWQGWRSVSWVVSVGQEPAGGRAPVDGAGWTGPLPPPGDPAPLTPRWCRLLPGAWCLLHRVTSTPILVSVGRIVIGRRGCFGAGAPGIHDEQLPLLVPPGRWRRVVDVGRSPGVNRCSTVHLASTDSSLRARLCAGRR